MKKRLLSIKALLLASLLFAVVFSSALVFYAVNPIHQMKRATNRALRYPDKVVFDHFEVLDRQRNDYVVAQGTFTINEQPHHLLVGLEADGPGWRVIGNTNSESEDGLVQNPKKIRVSIGAFSKSVIDSFIVGVRREKD